MDRSYFSGEQLTPPALRFDPSSIQASHQNARRGLILYGPYDAQRLGKDRVTASLIYPQGLERERDIVKEGLIHGNGAFPGFQDLFQIPIDFIDERRAKSEAWSDFSGEIKVILGGTSPDIVILLTSCKNEEIYRMAKAQLLGNGIPSQVVTGQKLANRDQVQWMLGNIALQIYAKAGGTPWTVQSTSRPHELVLGISRAVDRQRNLVVGFITLFTYDGDYQFLYSLSPKPTEWSKLDEYRDALAELIVEAYTEYKRQQGAPTSLVIHLCKRPGKYREIPAVEQALDRIADTVPYALVHLNDDSSYRLFDTAHATCIPETGIKVNLSSHSALLFLDGRPPGIPGAPRRKRGVPRVLEVVMDRRSTMQVNEFSRLVRQVFEFARVNWRGFNAQALPATLNYSYLVARLVAEIGAQNWNPIASAGRLRDKAWFL